MRVTCTIRLASCHLKIEDQYLETLFVRIKNAKIIIIKKIHICFLTEW